MTRPTSIDRIKERPILFSGPMVRALLDGTKTQTRRACRNQPYGNGFAFKDGDYLCHNDYLPPSAMMMDVRRGGLRYTTSDVEGWQSECPYGLPGERLWVRETFKAIASGEIRDGYGEVRYGWAYQADAATHWNEQPTIIHDLTGQPATGPMQFRPVPWKPSIHMPRAVSRILLEITDVRVERLHSISPSDAEAEGIRRLRLQENDLNPWWTGNVEAGMALHSRSALGAFHKLWSSINGPDAWDANPYVWALTFKVIKP